jgi:hypothetical protein
VAFVLKRGWVAFTLQQNGQPVPDASVLVIDEGGRQFAEGETGAEGRGEFPLPPGQSFLVEFKVGSRRADPIRLQRSGDGKRVEPANVLLSFGLRPCCRVVSRREQVETPEPSPATSHLVPVWLQGIIGTSFLLIGTGVLVFRLGRNGRSQSSEADA